MSFEVIDAWPRSVYVLGNMKESGEKPISILDEQLNFFFFFL